MEESKVNWEKLVEDCYKARKEVVTNSDLENLPAFTAKMNEEQFEFFMFYLKCGAKNLYFNFYYKGETVHYEEPPKLRLLGKEIGVGSIILNIPEFTGLWDGFVDKIICKLRYNYNEEEKTYNVKLTGHAITRPIKAENMEDLYYRMFGDRNIIAFKINEKVIKEFGNKPEDYYKDINYGIGFLGVGYFLRNYELDLKGMPSFKYDRTGVNHVTNERAFVLASAFEWSFGNVPNDFWYDRIKENLRGYKYTEYICRKVVRQVKDSEYRKSKVSWTDSYFYFNMNRWLYTEILEGKRSGKMPSIDDLQVSFKEDVCTYPALINHIEAYLIEEESRAFFDENNEVWYSNVYKPGRLFENTIEGVCEKEIYTILFLVFADCLYERVRDYDEYMENIRLMLDYSWSAVGYAPKYPDDELLVYDFFTDIKKEEFDKFFEAKKCNLNRDDYIVGIHRCEKFARILIKSSKFTFNRRK